jgi:hypothetical protein
MTASSGEIIEDNLFEEQDQLVVYASMPEFAKKLRDVEARRKLAETRLGTDRITYVRNMGYIAVEPAIIEHEQLKIEIPL